MPNSRNVNNLKINKLTEAQFDAAVEQELIGADEISILTDVDAGQVIQYEEMPEASLDNVDQIIQYVGPDYGQIYKNGHFYKCTEYPVPENAYVSGYDGSFTDLSVNTQAFGAAVDYADGSYTFVFDGSDWTLDGTAVNIIDDYGISFQGTPVQDNSITVEYNSEGQYYDWVQADVGGLPNQSGQEGKFLTTDGYNASWNNYIETFPTASNRMGTLINFRATYNGTTSTTRLMQAPASTTLYINGNFSASSSNSRDLGARSTPWRNVFASAISSGSGSTLYIPLGTGWGVMSAFFMPTPDASIEGSVLLYVGTTDATHTHGYAYECKAQGTDPETYAWERIDVQPSSGGLPTQTGNAGKFLTTDGTDASWSDKPLVNKSTSTGSLYIGTLAGTTEKSYAILIGAGSNTNGIGTTSVGWGSMTGGDYSSAFGRGASCYANNAIQISASASTTVNSDANTFKVANANGNYEIMSADGTVPTDRFTTTPSADGTYVPTLTIASGVATRTWSAPASGTSSISITLPANGWDSLLNIQRINVAGVTSSSTVIVGAAPSSLAEYTSCGVYCSGQGGGWLSFTCATTPSNDLTVTVLIM